MGDGGGKEREVLLFCAWWRYVWAHRRVQGRLDSAREASLHVLDHHRVLEEGVDDTAKLFAEEKDPCTESVSGEGGDTATLRRGYGREDKVRNS